MNVKRTAAYLASYYELAKFLYFTLSLLGYYHLSESLGTRFFFSSILGMRLIPAVLWFFLAFNAARYAVYKPLLLVVKIIDVLMVFLALLIQSSALYYLYQIIMGMVLEQLAANPFYPVTLGWMALIFLLDLISLIFLLSYNREKSDS
jgi:hypothetical protein